MPAGPDKGPAFLFALRAEHVQRMNVLMNRPDKTPSRTYSTGTATLIIAAVAVLLFVSAPVSAKEGFYLGVNTLFNDIGGEVNTGNTIATGYGAGLKGGYGFNRTIAVETAYWITDHDIAGGRMVRLKGYTADIKVSFQFTRSHIEPYLLAGAGNYHLDSWKGSGWNIGAGLDIYLFPKLSFNVGWTKRMLELGNAPKVPGHVDSLDFGLAYHFL